jgi:hypothetical protein
VLALRADVTVSLATPLGIVFEEVQPGEAKGLVVAGLVSFFKRIHKYTYRYMLHTTRYTSDNAIQKRYKTNACMLDTPMYSIYMLCTLRFGGPCLVATKLRCNTLNDSMGHRFRGATPKGMARYWLAIN